MLHSAETLSKRIDEAIRQIPFDLKPATRFDPIRCDLSVGGKRIRPLLLLMATDLFGKELESSLGPAIGIEIFHNFTLLHDDLMDNSDIRRGKPTVHRKYGTNSAILSGDAMLIESYRYMATAPPAILPELLALFTKTAMKVCQGQQLDMDFEKRSDVTESEYLEMIRLKTAVLLGCALKMGAMIGGATSQDAELLYDFGINIGLAFQLKDDLLDVYGDPRTFGKNIGGDILSNKKTFLLIKALENSNKEQNSALKEWILAETFDAEAKINAVKEIYDDLNLSR